MDRRGEGEGIGASDVERGGADAGLGRRVGAGWLSTGLGRRAGKYWTGEVGRMWAG